MQQKNREASTKEHVNAARRMSKATLEDQPDPAEAPLPPPLPRLAVAPCSRRADEAAGLIGDKHMSWHTAEEAPWTRHASAPNPHHHLKQHHHRRRHHDRPSNSVTTEPSRAPTPHSDILRLSRESGKTTPRLLETSEQREARKSPRSAFTQSPRLPSTLLQPERYNTTTVGHAPEPRGGVEGEWGREGGLNPISKNQTTKQGANNCGTTHPRKWFCTLLLSAQNCVQKMSYHLSVVAEGSVVSSPTTTHDHFRLLSK